MKCYWVIQDPQTLLPEDPVTIGVTEDEDLAMDLQDRGYVVFDVKGIESVNDL